MSNYKVKKCSPVPSVENIEVLANRLNNDREYFTKDGSNYSEYLAGMKSEKDWTEYISKQWQADVAEVKVWLMNMPIQKMTKICRENKIAWIVADLLR